ncbi:MAG: Glycoside hydrolase, family 57 [Ktedonobacterales bacterium]|nr:MAG: Glycoside hydrolase, family 57 [Ktedonobacterales bacterium]
MSSSTQHQYLCLYGHFYQPPRDDPFTGQIPLEPGATPYPNYNEKITVECYQPNAEAGNFDSITFDLGPTLAAWLEQRHPAVYVRILAADRLNVERYGVGNALAQAYNHTILPLATSRDKYTQIRWGLDDFAHRFGHTAEGMWLAETAVDLETLTILADCGVRYTVLAPWQTAASVDPTEPYRVALPGGREITVFFYNGPLSGGVSFDWDTTSNADTFAAAFLPNHLNAKKTASATNQMVLVATDGELYGHHKPWRDRFLSHLVREGAQAYGFEVTTLGRYLRDHPPTCEVELQVPSAWSCSHGVARWREGCDCTEGDSAWKPALRGALEHLALRLDEVFTGATAPMLADPWAARNGYLALRNGWQSAHEFWEQFGTNDGRPLSATAQHQAEQLLEAQYFGQCMFTSCGFFFEDLDRIEPRNDIAFARRAISLVWQAAQVNLEADFVRTLAEAQSWHTPGLTGADIYRQLPPVAPGLLPDKTQADPAA